MVDYVTKSEEHNDKRIIDELENIIFKGYPIKLRNFANYIVYNKLLNENNFKKKESIYIGDSTESMESNTILK